ncbi:MAG: hypothetical protein R3B84_14315 [Zavarzinella sp.]
MFTFNKINHVLNLHHDNPLFWSEIGLDVCIESCKNIEDDDWNRFHKNWYQANPEWQLRFANLLGFSDSNKALPLLLEFICKAPDRVGFEIIDSLKEFPLEQVLQLITEKELNTIYRLYSSSTGLEKMAMEYFLSQLQPNK